MDKQKYWSLYIIELIYLGLDGRWGMGMGMGYFSTPMSGYYHQMTPAMTGMASQFMSPGMDNLFTYLQMYKNEYVFRSSAIKF